MVVVDTQYASEIRTYNTDTPERSLTSLQATHKKELTGFAAYNTKKRSRQTFGDELTKYKNIADPPEQQDPLDWWIQHQGDYPVLKHLALTLLAAPASTAAVERLFSFAGNVVNE